ncbi:C-type lectin domain family 4 member M-like [Acipenser ruthenus]|uniref:C-type lectin domain family 4 member M-like n=1 Tax=Acipenser ruthenus TaxID=7906 RepID=UPI0027420C89|nr:C-type lectin domain family 4 member M-like [Acipenser ruthenus]
MEGSDIYGNMGFHQQTGRRALVDRRRIQAPAKTAVDDEEEVDYANIEDSIEPEEKTPNSKKPLAEEPKPQAATKSNACGAKSIVVLYILLIGSSAVWMALFSRAFAKYSEIAAVLQDLRTTQKTLQDNDSEIAAVLQDLRTTQKTLQDNDSQLSALVTSFGNDVSHLISKVSIKPCPCEWISFNEACYYFSKERADWHKAKESCNSKSASLAVISSDQELDYLKSRIGSTHYWLGLSDSETEGSWKWLDGRTVETRFWNSGEPNNAGNNEDCGKVTSSKLNDVPCNSEEHWICEMKL